MSHFLERLAARARGEAPVLGPRRRSRFEPGVGIEEQQEIIEAQQQQITTQENELNAMKERLDRLEYVCHLPPSG